MQLSLSNFRCWESKTLSIPSSGLCLINGKSGRGKSTILNSILYAVTGKLKNITTINKKSTKVSIKIDDITITRSRGPNRLLVEKDGKLYENDDAQSIINSIFGEEFSNTSYIDQDNINSFVSLSPSDKMEFLEKLLLTNYDINEIKDKIKVEISNTKTQFTSEESKQNTLENLIKTMTMIPQEILTIDKIKISKSNYSKILEKVKANCEVSEKNNKTVRTKIKKLEEEQNLYSKYTEQTKKINILLEELRSNPLYPEIEKIDSLNSCLELFEKSKNFYVKNKEYSNLKEKFEEIKKKYNILEEKNRIEKDDLNDQIKGLKEILSNKFISKKRILELEKCVDLIDTLSKLELELAENINYQEEIEKEEKNLNLYKESLSNKKLLLDNLQKSYTCPSCKCFLKIQEDKLILSNNIIDESIPSLKSNIEELKRNIKTTENSIETYKKNQIIYQQKENQYNELFDKLDSLRGDIECDKDIITEEIKLMNTYLKQFEDLNKKLQSLENDKLIEDTKKELKNINVKLDSYSYDFLESDKINDEYKINNDKEYEKCVQKISTISEKLNQIQKLKKQFIQLSNELNSIERVHYEHVNKDYYELLKIEREKLETYSEKIETYKSYIDQINIWERTTQQNEKYLELKESIETCSLNKQKLTDRLRCLVKLRDHVKNAEQKCISDFIDSLNEHASIYIEHFFPDEDIKVELKTTQESKSTGKEKISLNFNLSYRQINGDLSYLSGGERDRVNLAFTLAFSEIINNRVLLLDECISSLDAETTSIVLENLKEKYKGKLVILVSHQANLGFFDKVIDI